MESTPLFKDTRYDATLVSCDSNLLMNINNTTYDIKLFNVTYLNNKNIAISCPYLNKAESIAIELDMHANLNKGVYAYVFVDDELLQARLIEDNLVKISINNPEYKYYDTMNLEVLGVSASLEEHYSERHFDRTHGNKVIFFASFILLLFILVIIGSKIYKKS